jgi:hypothetical protein
MNSIQSNTYKALYAFLHSSAGMKLVRVVKSADKNSFKAGHFILTNEKLLTVLKFTNDEIQWNQKRCDHVSSASNKSPVSTFRNPKVMVSAEDSQSLPSQNVTNNLKCCSVIHTSREDVTPKVTNNETNVRPKLPQNREEYDEVVNLKMKTLNKNFWGDDLRNELSSFLNSLKRDIRKESATKGIICFLHRAGIGWVGRF